MLNDVLTEVTRVNEKQKCNVNIRLSGSPKNLQLPWVTFVKLFFTVHLQLNLKVHPSKGSRDSVFSNNATCDKKVLPRTGIEPGHARKHEK